MSAPIVFANNAAARRGKRNAHRRRVGLETLGQVPAARERRFGSHHENDRLADQVGDRRELKVLDVQLSGQERAQRRRGLNDQAVGVARELAQIIQRDAVTAARLIGNGERNLDQLVRLHDRLQRARGVVDAASRAGTHDELDRLVGFPVRPKCIIRIAHSADHNGK
jgi:hypothetical protein